MGQVDRSEGLVGNTAFKAPVKVATTANITLSGEQTIDDIACVEGDRVLVKNQTTDTQNGIWVVSTGNWNRAADFDGVYDVSNGTAVAVITGGTTNGDSVWRITSANPIIIDTSSITFEVLTYTDAASVLAAAASAAAAATSEANASTSETNAAASAVDAAASAAAAAAMSVGDVIHGAVADSLADADEMGFWQSASALLKKITVANIKAACAAGWTSFNQSGGSVNATTGEFSSLLTLTGGQIKFPATQNASTDANTLDDYEEGTWTPAVGGTATYNYQYGWYVKVGKSVTIGFYIYVNVFGSGGSTDSISGLPFISISNGINPGGAGGISLGGANTLATAVVSINCSIVVGSTGITFFSRTAAAASDSANALFTDSTTMYGGGSYIANA